jgi:hypothetical protein
MRSDAVKNGWRRFLDRLRRLWGQRSGGGFGTPLAGAAQARV